MVLFDGVGTFDTEVKKKNDNVLSIKSPASRVLTLKDLRESFELNPEKCEVMGIEKFGLESF